MQTDARRSWRMTSTMPRIMGEFRWTGFDYIGESGGWPRVQCVQLQEDGLGPLASFDTLPSSRFQAIADRPVLPATSSKSELMRA